MTWKVVAIAPLTGYAAYELERQHEHSSSLFARSFNSAVHQIVQGAGGVFYYGLAQKRHTPDQEAISDLVKGAGKKGVSNADADTLLDWAKEYDFPHRDDRGKLDGQGKPHWEGGEHIHLGPKHVKVN